MPGEAKSEHGSDDEESLLDSSSVSASAPHQPPPPNARGAEGITVYLRMRPTKSPSLYYNAVAKDGEYVNNTRTKFAFKFDSVLPMDISQEQVFARVGRPVVLNALEGYNSTIFAYGQTGSGKTYTITGGAERYADRGIIPRALAAIFAEFRARADHAWAAHVSYMEIYNEHGFDLLADGRGERGLPELPRVRMLEDERGNFHLRNLSMHRAASEEEALNLLFLGDTNRAISETAMNQASSRSHCLFTVFLEGRRVGSDRVLRSKLHMVDLAGSERVHKTKSDGQTLREAQYINTSLFYLEMVIVALNEKSKRGREHIPYRNSMMTSVLRDSLGGNCRTVMVATCSAEREQTEESISTCRFAQRVALVKNDATVNEETDPAAVIRRLRAEAATLRAEVAFLKGEAGEGDALTDGERAALAEACRAYVASRDAREQLRAAPLTLTRIRDCFAILKNLALEAQARPAADGGDAAALRRTLKERDDEIAILVNMVRQAKGQAPAGAKPAAPERKPSPLPRTPARDPRDVLAEERALAARARDVAGVPTGDVPPAVAADPARAYAHFRARARASGALEDNKLLLKSKYAEAKACGEAVNGARKAIAYLKQSVEQIRRERALGGGDADAATPEEIEKTRAIEAEKRAYKENFDALRGLKTQIEHIQRLLEHGRVRLTADFDRWYALVAHRAPLPPEEAPEADPPGRPAWGTPPAGAQPKAPATGCAAADDDVRAFYAAKEELGRMCKR